MQSDLIVRIIVAVIAIGILWVDFRTYCKQKINEQFGFGWGVFGILLFLACIIPGLNNWSKLFELEVFICLIVLGVIFFAVLFGMSKTVSQLVAKNQELAMQVSLLNNENANILRALKQFTGKDVLDNK